MRNFIICTHLQISLGKSRRMRWAGHVARMGEERKVYKVLVGRPEGKRPLGRPRRRWEDGIRMDLREIGLGGVVCPVAGCCECGDEPSGSCTTELVMKTKMVFEKCVQGQRQNKCCRICSGRNKKYD
jgi:hypothetical protein